jgi:hypothetical protein
MMSKILSIDVGCKNLALCLLQPGRDVHGSDDVIEHWRVLKIPSEPGGIVQTLESEGVLQLPWADVVVEQQPGRLNLGMKKIQHYIEMFFAAHGRPVYVYDARHKLTYAAASPYWPGIDTVWTYASRKKAAVNTAIAFLTATESANSAAKMIFDNARKKDDLADSLLQGMAFAHKEVVRKTRTNASHDTTMDLGTAQ